MMNKRINPNNHLIGRTTTTTDMDECRTEPCGAGAQCTNIPGGYRCSCGAGFERNPAFPAALLGGDLSAGDADLLGQVGANSTTTPIACLDVNECLLGAAPTAGRQVCGTGAQCTNTAGGYFCSCPPNFTGNPKVACVDIDECSSHACGPNTVCKNTPGSYKCECKPGFTGES